MDGHWGRSMFITLHMGMHKTGTSSLQHWLGANARKLARDNISVKTHWTDLNVRNPLHFAPDRARAELARLKAQGVERLIVSDETLSLFSRSQHQALAEILQGYIVDAVIVFRHWCGYLPSRWAQNVKRRDAEPFGEFLERRGGPDRDFRLVMDNLSGLELRNIRVVSYDNAVAGAGVVRTVADALGLQAEPVEDARRNPAWAVADIDRLRLFNGAFADATGVGPNDMMASFATYRPPDRYFDLPYSKVMGAAQKSRGHLDGLDRMIAEAGRDFAMSPEFFRLSEKELEARVEGLVVNPVHGKLFGTVEPQMVTASDLSFEHLPADLKDWLRGIVRKCVPAGR